MADIPKSGCFGCRHSEWDADGATCALTGLLVGNYGQDCQKRVAEKQTDSTELHKVSSKPKSEQYMKIDEGVKMTNADRIRCMTDEELAEWLDLHGECNQCAYHPVQCNTDCNEGHLKWLRQDVPEVCEDADDS